MTTTAPAYYIAVITKVPEPVRHFDEQGNLTRVTVSTGNLALGSAWSTPLVGYHDEATMVFDPEHMILGPVFGLGEILFLSPGTDREIIGGGRKPDKWDVEYAVVDTLDEAIALSNSLTRYP